MVRGAYDLQKLRIQMGNRIVANFKARLGQEAGMPETELNAESKMILNTFRASFKKLTDGAKSFPRQGVFKGDEVISSYTELCLLSQYFSMEDDEKTHFLRLEKTLREFPVYQTFLADVKGVGPAMAGILISEIDINKATYPSSLWKYAGLDVCPDGLGRSRRKEHQVDEEYVVDNELKVKRGLSFNPFLKTKLIGVLASSFLRAGDNPYSRIYNGYKNRIANMPAHAEKSKGHIHNMSLRYMIKQFLVDLHREWRLAEGLPVSTPYSEGKLGIVHGEAK